MVKPTLILALVAALLLGIAVACGGASTQPAATSAPAVAPTADTAAAPAAATTAPDAATAAPAVATAVPTEAAMPAAVAASAERLSIATIPPAQEIVGSWQGTTTSANTQVRPFTDPLVQTDRLTGELIPGLATEWSFTPDGKKWTFQLRDDVEFQRGYGPFTAQDVVHSAALVIREGAKATDTGLFRSLFGNTEAELMENVIAVDDETVEFNLATPNLLMDFFAGSQQGSLFIYSKNQFDTEGFEAATDQPAGVGPWQFESRNLKVDLLYSRVEDHWRQSPYFAEMEYKLIPEEGTRLAQLQTGQVQIGEISRRLHDDAVDAGLAVLQSEGTAIQVAFIIGGVYNPDAAGPCQEEGKTGCFYQDGEPHLDVRVREAINRAINRQEIMDGLFGGIGRPHQVWGYHPDLQGWNTRWEEEFDAKYGYDQERAKELLKEAGQEGYELRLLLTELAGVPEMIPMGEAAFSYLKAVGIDVKSEAVEWATYRADYYRPGKTHGTLAATRGSYRPPDITLRFYNRSGDAGFWRTSVDPMTDVLYDKATQATDLDVKDKALRDLGDLKFDLYSEVPIVWLPAQLVVDPKAIGEMRWPGNINASFTHTEYIQPAN